ncbi:PREDICTED: uncharacterized protein LOC109176683 [Ipomoea nil]|uniref:uncharacterized protein LOC109176683 n=1 Tax=Ipomoea nil TaxID=35883 RepID=UPI000901796D|nr:PREDICTED: uncharacterized protein LOC109176683 [Ipomoea nil]
MVSEPWKISYAAAISGETGQSSRTPVMNQPPIQAAPQTSIPQVVPQRSATEDVENPLYLNTNENPNSVLVRTPLTGSFNYGSWSISMQVPLEVKNKWSIVDGSIEKPDRNHGHYASSRRCNLMIKSWILKAVHPSIAQSIIYMDDAKEIWNDLKKRFSQRDPHRISILQCEIYGLRQGNLSINENYTKCRSLWEEMNEMRPLPICKCNPHCLCSGALIDEVRKDREIDQIIRFLQGLNDDYNPLKSSVLVLDPLPEIHKVYVMAEKFEKQLNLNSLNLETSHANSIQSNPKATEEVVAAVNQYYGKRNMNSGGNKSAKCTYCGMTGHTVEKCYKKHGYPPGWVPGYKSKGKQSAIAAPTAGSSLDTACSNPENNIASEQIQKLISLLQTQMGHNQPPMSAAVSLVPKFDKPEAQNTGKSHTVSHAINFVNLDSTTWILDSGATDHIVCSREFFNVCHVVQGARVNLPNGETVIVQHMGDINLGKELWLRNALHIPQFKFNIVSVSKLIKDSSHTLIFDSGQCRIQSDGRTTDFAREDRGLYLLLQPQKISLHSNSIVQCNSAMATIELWHKRLGHFPFNKIHLLCDIPNSQSKMDPCDVCHYAKQKRLPFPLSSTSSKAIFNLIHVDIWGPFPVKYMGGERYFLTIVDDYSRYTWIHLMRNKSETREKLKNFHKQIHTHHGLAIKTLRSDNGMEFNLVDFFAEHGIIHQRSCVHTPQQNAVVERKHHHIMSVARALRFQEKLPLEFWGLCVMHAAFIINRLPSSVTDWISPYQKLYGEKPTLENIKIFGCLCYAATLPNQRHKMASRSRRCVFVGQLNVYI